MADSHKLVEERYSITAAFTQDAAQYFNVERITVLSRCAWDLAEIDRQRREEGLIQ